MNTASPFITALRSLIIGAVSEHQKAGVKEISLSTLRQSVAAPSYRLDGAPSGKAEVYLYGQMFAREATKLIPSLVINGREVIL